MYENYKDWVFNDKIILQPQQGFRSDNHEVHRKNLNKTVLSSNGGKRLQTFDRVTRYLHGTNILKVCESEMLKVCKAKAILKILSKECKMRKYVKEKEKCEISLKYVKAKCECEMGKMWKWKMLSKYNWKILMIIQMKIKLDVTQIGHIFQTIHTGY